MKRKTGFGLIWSSILLLAVLSGCAEKGPILLSLGYQQPTEAAAAPIKKTISVSPLKDSRGVSESVVGLRTIPDGLQNDFVVQGSVAGLVQSSLKTAIKSRGITAVDGPAWDCTLAGVKMDKADFQIGGEIKWLWIESKATVLTTHMKAVAQLKLCVADAADKNTVRTIVTNSVVEQDYIYSQEKLESVLSEAITGSIDQVFKDEALKEKLQ